MGNFYKTASTRALEAPLWALMRPASALRLLMVALVLALGHPAVHAAPPPTKSPLPGIGKQTRTRDKRLDAKATEKSIKASIQNQEEILALEDKGSQSYPKQAIALADFYWDLAEFYGNRVNSEDIEKPLYEAQQKKDQKGIDKWTREQQRLTDLKQKFQEETIKRYRDIAKRFTRAENLDEIRYFLAYNLPEMGRGDEGVEE